MLSRKEDLINRNFAVSTYSGSDFTRNMQYPGDHVFTRFLTISGKVEDSWRSDEVIPIDNLEIQVLVPKAKQGLDKKRKQGPVFHLSKALACPKQGNAALVLWLWVKAAVSNALNNAWLKGILGQNS